MFLLAWRCSARTSSSKAGAVIETDDGLFPAANAVCKRILQDAEATAEVGPSTNLINYCEYEDKKHFEITMRNNKKK